MNRKKTKNFLLAAALASTLCLQVARAEDPGDGTTGGDPIPRPHAVAPSPVRTIINTLLVLVLVGVA